MVRLGTPQQVPSSLPPTGGADWAGASGLSISGASTSGAAVIAGAGPCVRIGAMELTWYGRTCVRLRGKDAVVVADPYPVGRRADRPRDHRRHRHLQPPRRRAAAAKAKGKLSRDGATLLPVQPRRRVRARRARASTRSRRSSSPASGPTATTPKGAERGKQVAFVVELDGVHTIHLGDIGHLLTEEKLGDIGSVDIACVPLGGALTPTNAAALVAQLDPKIVVPMPVCEDEADCAEALATFFHEMGAEPIDPAQAVGDRVEPAGRDDHGPPGVARQAGLTPRRRGPSGQPRGRGRPARA